MIYINLLDKSRVKVQYTKTIIDLWLDKKVSLQEAASCYYILTYCSQKQAWDFMKHILTIHLNKQNKLC